MNTETVKPEQQENEARGLMLLGQITMVAIELGTFFAALYITHGNIKIAFNSAFVAGGIIFMFCFVGSFLGDLSREGFFVSHAVLGDTALAILAAAGAVMLCRGADVLRASRTDIVLGIVIGVMGLLLLVEGVSSVRDIQRESQSRLTSPVSSLIQFAAIFVPIFLLALFRTT